MKYKMKNIEEERINIQRMEGSLVSSRLVFC